MVLHKNPQETVLFDGECNFCTSQIGWLRRLNWGNRLEFLSLHDPSTRVRFGFLTHEQLMEQMWVVRSTGEAYGGAEAVRFLTRRLPALYWLAPLLHIPFSMPIWSFLYRIVARYRYHLAGRTCENGTCELHIPKKKTL